MRPKLLPKSETEKMARPGKPGKPTDYFVGNEVERTAAFGKRTLFIVGLQPHGPAIERAKEQEVEHIYLAANHSYSPNRTKGWLALALAFLQNPRKSYWVTLEIPQEFVYEWEEYGSALAEKRFIPMLSIPLPGIAKVLDKLVLKADDMEFGGDNGGVWTADACAAFRTSNFTPWSDYEKDRPIK